MKAKSATISEPSNTPSVDREEMYGTTAGAILLTLAILLLLFSRVERLAAYIPKLKLNKPRVDRLPQVKCERCQYFHNSLYIKCAVRPIDVMTTSASDCQDYDPKAEIPAVKKLDKIRLNMFNLFDN